MMITDLIMPKLRGDKLIRDVKAICPGIRTILCSGFSESTEAEKAAQALADVFLRKPVTREQLAQTVRKVLDKNKV